MCFSNNYFVRRNLYTFNLCSLFFVGLASRLRSTLSICFSVFCEITWNVGPMNCVAEQTKKKRFVRISGGNLDQSIGIYKICSAKTQTDCYTNIHTGVCLQIHLWYVLRIVMQIVHSWMAIFFYVVYIALGL